MKIPFVIPAKAGIQYLALAALCVGAAYAQDAVLPASPNVKPRAAEFAKYAAETLLLGITRVDGKLVAVGDRGNILHSSDGEQWTQVNAPVNVTLTAVAFADDKNGWVVGHDAVILHTKDSGKIWQLQNFRPDLNKPLFGVLALDAQHAFALGAYGLFLETRDGGVNWNEVPAPTILDDGLHLNALIKLGNGELFIVGETGLIGIYGIDPETLKPKPKPKTVPAQRASALGAAASAVIAAPPVPAGPSWQRLTLPYEGSLFGALPRGEKGALVFGLRGNVYVSDDARGGVWTKIETGTTQSMFGGVVLPDGQIALVGADGAAIIINHAGAVRSTRTAGDDQVFGSGTLSGVLPWKDGLLVVGELGVDKVKISQ